MNNIPKTKMFKYMERTFTIIAKWHSQGQLSDYEVQEIGSKNTRKIKADRFHKLINQNQIEIL